MHKKMSISESGQAGVQVTPEMVEAGVRVFREWEAQAACYDDAYALDMDAEELVGRLFKVLCGSASPRGT